VPTGASGALDAAPSLSHDVIILRRRYPREIVAAAMMSGACTFRSVATKLIGSKASAGGGLRATAAEGRRVNRRGRAATDVSGINRYVGRRGGGHSIGVFVNRRSRFDTLLARTSKTLTCCFFRLICVQTYIYELYIRYA